MIRNNSIVFFYILFLCSIVPIVVSVIYLALITRN